MLSGCAYVCATSLDSVTSWSGVRPGNCFLRPAIASRSTDKHPGLYLPGSLRFHSDLEQRPHSGRHGEV